MIIPGILGDCICKQNEEDYIRSCPVHAPSESERELARKLLYTAGQAWGTPQTRELMAKAAAVIDIQVTRQDNLVYYIQKLEEEIRKKNEQIRQSNATNS